MVINKVQLIKKLILLLLIFNCSHNVSNHTKKTLSKQKLNSDENNKFNYDRFKENNYINKQEFFEWIRIYKKKNPNSVKAINKLEQFMIKLILNEYWGKHMFEALIFDINHREFSNEDISQENKACYNRLFVDASLNETDFILGGIYFYNYNSQIQYSIYANFCKSCGETVFDEAIKLNKFLKEKIQSNIEKSKKHIISRFEELINLYMKQFFINQSFKSQSNIKDHFSEIFNIIPVSKVTDDFIKIKALNFLSNFERLETIESMKKKFFYENLKKKIFYEYFMEFKLICHKLEVLYLESSEPENLIMLKHQKNCFGKNFFQQIDMKELALFFLKFEKKYDIFVNQQEIYNQLMLLCYRHPLTILDGIVPDSLEYLEKFILKFKEKLTLTKINFLNYFKNSLDFLFFSYNPKSKINYYIKDSQVKNNILEFTIKDNEENTKFHVMKISDFINIYCLYSNHYFYIPNCIIKLIEKFSISDSIFSPKKILETNNFDYIVLSKSLIENIKFNERIKDILKNIDIKKELKELEEIFNSYNQNSKIKITNYTEFMNFFIKGSSYENSLKELVTVLKKDNDDEYKNLKKRITCIFLIMCYYKGYNFYKLKKYNLIELFNDIRNSNIFNFYFKLGCFIVSSILKPYLRSKDLFKNKKIL